MLPAFSKPRQNLVLIVSGPAGSGKTTVCERLLEEFSGQACRVITATSRTPRDGEIHGQDYYFIPADQFQERIDQGDFYEHAHVHGRHYGVLKEEVLGKLNAGHDLIINVDVQGAATFRKCANEDPQLQGRVAFIFIMPACKEQLIARLGNRGTDDAAEIERRMQSALSEITHWNRYDYVICSDTRDADYDRLRAIYLAETLKCNRLECSFTGK